jgi:hypothetical protein
VTDRNANASRAAAISPTRAPQKRRPTKNVAATPAIASRAVTVRAKVQIGVGSIANCFEITPNSRSLNGSTANQARRPRYIRYV